MSRDSLRGFAHLGLLATLLQSFPKFVTSIDRLRWRCRRGMRELDIVLERFLDRRYHQLAEADQLRFAELLDQADQDIMAWLLGTSQPGDPVSLKLIDEIRSTSEVVNKSAAHPDRCVACSLAPRLSS